MSEPRIVTSYLAHPLWREKREGVLRVPVCLHLGWYTDRKDAYFFGLVPSHAAVLAGKRGDFEPYIEGLDDWEPQEIRDALDCLADEYPLVVLLCWEADPMQCHRRFALEALRPEHLWTPEDEVKSPYGGLAEVGLCLKKL